MTHKPRSPALIFIKSVTNFSYTLYIVLASWTREKVY